MRRRFKSSLLEKSRKDCDAVRADELLNEADDLRQQEFLAAFPVLLHLVVDVARCLEDDFLRAKLARETLKVDLGDSGNVWLAFKNRRQFGQLRGLAGIEFQRLYLAPSQARAAACRRDRCG